MTPRELRKLDQRLTVFVQNLLSPLGRSERRHWARVYVEGLLLDGKRKSIEPMANRIPGADVQALRQFVGQSPWPVEAIGQPLAWKVVDLLSEPEVWIVEETASPKAGQHSVGVARQYCEALGKVINCQVAVSLHWSSSEANCPLLWRLYLPKVWLEHAARAREVRLPPGTVYRSKTELAMEAIDQALAWGLPPLPVVAGLPYGNDLGFRQALGERGLHYVVQVDARTLVWTEDPNLPESTLGKKKTGRPRKYPAMEALKHPQSLDKMVHRLPASAWRKVTWHAGRRDDQRSRFALLKVWSAHDWQARKHPKREAEWLLIEWPQEEKQPTKYWLAQLGSQPPGLCRFVRIAKSRWRIEQECQELKEDLGLDHYEGRHWLGWHHHMTLVTMAYAFLQAERARPKKHFWCDFTEGEGTTADHSH